MRENLYLSGRKKKIRPDFGGTSTLVLLEKVTEEALRLREENQRLTAELKTSLRRAKPTVKKELKPKQAKKTDAASVEFEAAPAAMLEKKTRPRRQALGAGLARFLGARRPF